MRWMSRLVFVLAFAACSGGGGHPDADVLADLATDPGSTADRGPDAADAPADLPADAASELPSDAADTPDPFAPADLPDAADLPDSADAPDAFQPCLKDGDCPAGWSCVHRETGAPSLPLEVLFVCAPCGACEPACPQGAACGDDGCGGSCGTCPEYLACMDHQCVNIDVPDCGVRECGSDGLGGICGVCPAGWTCQAGGTCEPPACTDIPAAGMCVGGSVLTCENALGALPTVKHRPCPFRACTVRADGPADCAPVACLRDCFGRTCGDDGCGGSCGTCPDGESCDPGRGICLPASGCGTVPAAGECQEGHVVRCVDGAVAVESCLAKGQWCFDASCRPGGAACAPVGVGTPCGDVPPGGHCEGTDHAFRCQDGALAVDHCRDFWAASTCGRIDLERRGCSALFPPLAPCPTPLDAETLAQLRISLFPDLQVQPGGTLDLSLNVTKCCVYLEEVPACATWSIDPPAGATIDPVTGVVQVSPDTPSGTSYTITANVEHGRRLLSIRLYVFTPEGNPLVGTWHEQARIACGTGQESSPADPIGELLFRASGVFNVTWTPFETYVDYQGQYDWDPATGAITMTVAYGNYVPADLDLSGTATVNGDELILGDLWLGTGPGGQPPAACGHRFKRP